MKKLPRLLSMLLFLCLFVSGCGAPAVDTELPSQMPIADSAELAEMPTESPAEGSAPAAGSPVQEPPPAETLSHTHEFLPATCTEPQTCVCGATEGVAPGHSWKDATCTVPKTCSSCGNQSGLAAGHKFSAGSCSVCGAPDPDRITVNMVWIPTNGGKKYHTTSSCSNMKNPEQVTQAVAESQGFTPCKRCH